MAEPLSSEPLSFNLQYLSTNRYARYGNKCEEQAMKVNWKGVIPAITTPFNADLTVDESFLAKHSRWLVDEGSVGVVSIGELGASAALSRADKRTVVETFVNALGDPEARMLVVAALST